MKKLAMLTLCVAASASLAGSAFAAEGCGPGAHRNSYGHCRTDGLAIAPGLVIGNFYAGHGYWDGHRYWGHRERFHGNWRYR